jgi:hypothetical protein
MIIQFSSRFGAFQGQRVELMAGQFASLRFLADPSAPAINSAGLDLQHAFPDFPHKSLFITTHHHRRITGPHWGVNLLCEKNDLFFEENSRSLQSPQNIGNMGLH